MLVVILVINVISLLDEADLPGPSKPYTVPPNRIKVKGPLVRFCGPSRFADVMGFFVFSK